MKKILVLGCGRIGSAIARDLYTEYDVVCVDNNPSSLKDINELYGLSTLEADLSDISSFSQELKTCDLVISAVPGFMGFELLKKLIEVGKDVVDISFFNEDAFELDALAKEKGVTAVVDCGVAPGLCNIMLGHHLADSDIISYTCYVGGLPVQRMKPWEYKAPFSPIDVIEEYVRPARMRINGKEEIREALSDIEEMHFEETGKLEAFNTDGLRSILRTTTIPNLKEKTLRYPGHARMMELFRQAGLFSKEKVNIGNEEIRPLDLTSRLLFDQWKMDDNEREFTIMKVELETQTEKIEYLVFDETNFEEKMTSMARTTGFTCSSVARLVIQGKYAHYGIIAPEILGKEKNCAQSIFNDLKERSISIIEKRSKK